MGIDLDFGRFFKRSRSCIWLWEKILMIRTLAASVASVLVLGSSAIASTSVSVESAGFEQIRLLSSTSYQQYESALGRSVRNAPQGAAVRLETDRWMHFGRAVSEAIRDRSDLKFVIEYRTPEDACTAPVSRSELVGRLSNPAGNASFPILCLAFAHDEAEVLANWKPGDHAALEKLSREERRYYRNALRSEMRIRRDIVEVAESLGGRPVKLITRLKSPSSTYEKMRLRTTPRPITDLTDLVRYTVLFTEDRYTDGARRMISELSSRGYELGSLWNAWTDGSVPYRGLNLVFCDRSNSFMELQFHTPASNDATTKDHPLYEKRRLLPAGSPELLRLERLSQETYSAVPVPAGVERIGTFGRPLDAQKFLQKRRERGVGAASN